MVLACPLRFICKTPAPLLAIIQHENLADKIEEIAFKRGDCAHGNFKGTIRNVIVTITPNEEHPFNKVDIVEFISEDGTVAYILKDHGIDI